jgi:23S rRNA (cytosine1962-C5)-methyltransferase
MNLPKIQLKKDEERRLLAGHLWIYSNEIDTNATPLKQFKPGELVTITNANFKKLGIGYINPNNLLCVRVLTRNSEQIIDQGFFNQRILNALALRERYFAKPYYRLVFGESDYLPGLIVDRYAETLVVQINTAGMEQLKPLIIEALLTTIKPQHILLRNDSESRLLEGLTTYIEPAFSQPPEMIELEENGIKFNAPIYSGQKTGWFYDHRYNRSRLMDYVKDKRVLDVCSYIGGWGVTAANFGAETVTCIDSSVKSLELAIANARKNKLAEKIQIMADDAFDAMLQLIDSQEQFDVIILDPPAFIKKRKDMSNGLKAYERLNRLALRLLAPNGILFTSSCSMHLSRDDLLNIVRKAGLSTEKNITIVEQLHQAQDHPIHPAIKETEYLKGFVVYAP